MKNHMLKALIGLVFMMSCSKTIEDPELSVGLEQRGNDNHRNWSLAQVDLDYSYAYTDGDEGTVTRRQNFEYSCVRPFGKIIGSTDIAEANGEPWFDNSRTMSFNDNFLIDVEHAFEYGDEVVRTFNYDSDGHWTGITTTVNGEVLDEQIEIDPYGQVKSYTSGGVRIEYTWRDGNSKLLKIYVLATSDLKSVENSSAFNKSGNNEISRKATKQNVLKAFKELQTVRNTASGSLRSKTDGWVLIAVEEDFFDQKVYEAYRSTGNGYPGTTSDAGYYNLSKNFVVSWKAYLVEPDGTPIREYYNFKRDSYSVRDNLPVKTHYTYDIFGEYEDEAGNPVDYHEEGTEHFQYVSGCNQKEH